MKRKQKEWMRECSRLIPKIQQPGLAETIMQGRYYQYKIDQKNSFVNVYLKVSTLYVQTLWLADKDELWHFIYKSPDHISYYKILLDFRYILEKQK